MRPVGGAGVEGAGNGVKEREHGREGLVNRFGKMDCRRLVGRWPVLLFERMHRFVAETSLV